MKQFFLSRSLSEKKISLLLLFQISYGDMIACDNENVSHLGAKQSRLISYFSEYKIVPFTF
jgi:hypothetical protein